MEELKGKKPEQMLQLQYFYKNKLLSIHGTTNIDHLSANIRR